MIAASERSDTSGHHGHHRRCYLLVAHPDGDTGAASRRPIEVIGTEAELEPALLRTVVTEAARDVDAEGTQLRVADRLTFDEDRDLRVESGSYAHPSTRSALTSSTEKRSMPANLPARFRPARLLRVAGDEPAVQGPAATVAPCGGCSGLAASLRRSPIARNLTAVRRGN